MTAVILSSTGSFDGVSYNTEKMDNGKGELMLVQNFGAVEKFENPGPEDYKNYLKNVSALNKGVTNPQLHAAISCKGREYDKVQLTAIAVKWLEEMGYSKNPYMIIFHNDTKNNHVHIVSTRITKEGKTVDDSFEKSRAVRDINKVIGVDINTGAKQDIEKALQYQFSTKSQLMAVLESRGYTLTTSDDNIDLIKFGKKLESLPLVNIENKIGNYVKDGQRINQIRAIIAKYKQVHSPELVPKTIPLPGGFKKETQGFTSDLSEYLKERLNIELIFHAKDNKQPYGYTIIDHANQNVFKGSEVLQLKELIQNNLLSKTNDNVITSGAFSTKKLNEDDKNYYSSIAKAALYNYPDIKQGLAAQGLSLVSNEKVFYIQDNLTGDIIEINDLLNKEETFKITGLINQPSFNSEKIGASQPSASIPTIQLAADQDDGLKRRRKKNNNR